MRKGLPTFESCLKLELASCLSMTSSSSSTFRWTRFVAGMAPKAWTAQTRQAMERVSDRFAWMSLAIQD